MTASHAARVGAAEIADALGQFPPTAEQTAVIEAPLEPVLVVAGAGAGKTETMAARVVWLVANGLVEPSQVLGLTFTRKAAGQLTDRIRRRLARLAGSSLLRDVDPGGGIRDRLRSAEPEVSTYHSYAGRLLGEYGLLLPMEPSVRMLGETELWQIAHRVVSTWDGDIDTDSSPATITEQVLKLANQLGEHLVDPADLDRSHVELEHLVFTLPPGPRQRAEPSQKLTGPLAVQERRVALLPLVRRLAEELRAQGALDPGSQMSLAARLASAHAEVGEAERARFRAAMLDEYQDTGHSQRVLLSSLFGGGHADPDRDDGDARGAAAVALTSVGDPMQSIYGWRGASAANLPYFTTDFPTGRRPARILELLTSWRNPAEALTLANAVAAPLRERGVPVSELRPRPDVPPGDLRAALLPDVDAEREWLAGHIATRFDVARAAGDPPPTTAVLVRRNADSVPIAEALRERGVPVEVVGVGGLLQQPEVRDVVDTLRLVADPLAGTAAMRVLTGPRVRLGAADLGALARRVRELGRHGRPGTQGLLSDEDELHDALAAALPGDEGDEAGLGDAIADPGPAERYSREGHRRITALARRLASLRRRIGQPLTELTAEVERSLDIGIEVAARSGNTGGGREQLDAFAMVVAEYAADPHATLTGLLGYLSAAESVEKGLTPGEVELDPHRVQILTVHASKGLEWQVVAVPHLVGGVFPADRGTSTWMGDVTELPPQLRGDRAAEDGGEGVPVPDLDGCTTRKDLENALDAHKKALARRRLEEERRLFYVAVTRTEHTLLLSGHHWPASGKAKGPSVFLTEARDILESGAGRVEQWAPEPDDTENPLAAHPRTSQWPVDPLAGRRDDVEEGARMVLDELDAAEYAAEEDRADAPRDDPDDGSGAVAGGESAPEDPEGWAADVELLLAERAAAADRALEVPLPARLSVSQMVQLRADPDVLAERLRRPVPYKPNPLARRGTAFHAWVERRFGATRLLDLDELPGAADTGAEPGADLQALQESFLASPWASRSPVEVEVPFETVIGGVLLRGRIDAVFRDDDGGWTVIDWKTGAPPTPAEEPAVAIQLAVYRVAWAELMASGGTGTGDGAVAAAPPLERVRAAFHYVRSGRTAAPPDLPDADELAALLEAAPESSGGR
ncbi:ATP-dependent helicase [Tomitella fengzijianii]|uniref:DNA 3'-5' helicase n=1 Tax=Tomitella fengzijianii TaxID=2597660 RepID=A0A516X522_9ACTN|nr:ATP-dependent DNA helicase [Tomitella fengzijianii]QDQ98169.1 ATP-dependent helicase [Tomitella fengzijianii]